MILILLGPPTLRNGQKGSLGVRGADQCYLTGVGHRALQPGSRVGSGGSAATKGRREGGRSWFTGTTLRVTQASENSPFSPVCIIVGQWGTSLLHTHRQGAREEEEWDFCSSWAYSSTWPLWNHQVTTYWAPTMCLALDLAFQIVSLLNTRNNIFLKFRISYFITYKTLGLLLILPSL